MDLGEVLPWGLTVGQTLCLGIGGLMVLGAWVIFTTMLRLGKSIIMCGLVVIMGSLFCASVAFATYQLTR